MAKDSEPPKATAHVESDQAKQAARIFARASVAKTREYPKWPSSVTGGVMPMTIVGRFDQERERLGPDFTEVDRQWRIQWHKDQHLDHHEPRPVPQLYASTNNIFRRFYKAPLNYVEANILAPRLGAEGARTARVCMGKGALIYLTGLYIWYTLKYNHNTWEKVNGWQVYFDRPEVLPGDAAYPMPNPRPNAEDFYDNGFSKRNVFRN